MDGVTLYDGGVYLLQGTTVVPQNDHEALIGLTGGVPNCEEARRGTIAHGIMQAHNASGDESRLKVTFDCLTSHDITYVGIVQTAKASGLEKFPMPYVLTTCHNTLCAVGGTINEDDHLFGLSAAKHYGGIYVPPHMAVIHQYMREMMAGCGKMILGSDSHTRYGALGTMAIGEGGGELVKQLLGQTYDVATPDVVAVYLEGSCQPFVGPQDVALAIIGAVFSCGYVKNKVMEFVGPGVATMTTDFRNGVDVMTTETTCLSSIWRTDDDTRRYLADHGRADDYRQLDPADVAYYDGCVRVDLSKIRPMIALPFHPSNVYTIDELNANPRDILAEVERAADKIAGRVGSLDLMSKVDDAGIHVQQGVIAGCAGGNYTNVMEAANALRGKSCGSGEFALSVYPSSQPVFADLVKKGAVYDLMQAGAIVRTAFCGPCFGAGDTPANNCLSVRHTTRNFPNREGSKPGNGQMSGVALMDARSIAATAAVGGILTGADALDCWGDVPEHEFDATSYNNRVFCGFGCGKQEDPLVYGPNIKDWPQMEPLGENLLMQVCSKIMDPVTTTDELIPSGETSSYRSNPLGLAEFTLSRRDPEYVGRAKAFAAVESQRLEGELAAEVADAFSAAQQVEPAASLGNTEMGSMIYAVKPGDGSAREQAASCQRVLGGVANIVEQYATKRYRSNVINWGMLPLQSDDVPQFEVGDYVFIPGVRKAVEAGEERFAGHIIRNGQVSGTIDLYMAPLTADERQIILDGCLINFNRNKK